MDSGKAVYFVSDVHLGLKTADPAEREARFVRFLKELPREETGVLCMLGDIWDFWFEYRDVIPRVGIRVVSELIQLMDDGVEVWFCPGNHDIWTFSFFESLGMKRVEQPYRVEIGGRKFCLGHGDALGDTKWSYKLMLWVFHSHVMQRLFSTLHPWLAYRFGLGWSDSNRRTHKKYVFKGEKEPLYGYCMSQESVEHCDYYIFGHFHTGAEMDLPGGAKMVIVKDWMDGGMPYAKFADGVLSTSFPEE